MPCRSRRHDDAGAACRRAQSVDTFLADREEAELSKLFVFNNQQWSESPRRAELATLIDIDLLRFECRDRGVRLPGRY